MYPRPLCGPLSALFISIHVGVSLAFVALSRFVAALALAGAFLASGAPSLSALCGWDSPSASRDLRRRF